MLYVSVVTGSILPVAVPVVGPTQDLQESFIKADVFSCV